MSIPPSQRAIRARNRTRATADGSKAAPPSSMVAISLYRGNLHRVPDTPRRWPMPPHALSLRHFKTLLHNRSRALSRLLPAPNPNPNPSPKPEKMATNKVKDEEEEEGTADNGCSRSNPPAQPSRPEATSSIPIPNQTDNGREEEEAKGAESKGAAAEIEITKDEKMEVTDKLDTVTDKAKRRNELESKLQVLNEKKHHLVQMLKQILNAEEEIKRHSMQSSVLRPSMQTENAVDTGSATRLVPKLSVEVNFGSNLGGESDAVANHNAHARQLHLMHNTSPSAASLSRPSHGPFQHTVVPSIPRTSLANVGLNPCSLAIGGGAAVSPSRFAPTGNQGHHHHSSSLPTVSAPGTHFVASSPSPAASGGTSSVFRDSRLTNSS